MNRIIFPVSFFVLLFIVGLLASSASAAPKVKRPDRSKKTAAVQAAPDGPACKAEILLEAGSGDIVFEQNAHEPLPPASMIKTLLIYTVMKRLEEGTIKLSDIITASAHVSKIGGSQVFLREGEQFTLEQLLEAVIVHSANDAAAAIAEHIGGSTEGFVDLMKLEAESLGLKEAEIYSPHGLPPGKGQKPDLISAANLAALVRAIVEKYPKVLEFSSKPMATFRGGSFEMLNTNRLVARYPGCDGLKTGYYGGAGFGVSATAIRNGTRMIAVVMGCQNGKKRFDEAARLLSLGFAQYKLVRLVEKGAVAEQQAAVQNGEKAAVPLAAAKELLVSVKPGDQAKIIRKEIPCTPLSAPVAAGTSCGSSTFFLGERQIGSVELQTTESVPMLSTTGRLLRLMHLR